MNIEQVKNLIKSAALADDTVLIQGKHGIGKSDVVKQVQRELDWHLETLFLSTQEVGDLIGIPHIEIVNGISVTTWAKPVWLHRMDSAAKQGKKCLLFLDELNRAPLDIRQASLELVLERRIHEHELPCVDGQRTMVVAAVNPSSDYQVEELDAALLDRFLFCDIEVDVAAWLNWGRTKVNSCVRDFIAANPNRLHFTPDDGVGATPRSWAKLGDYLDNDKNMTAETLFNVAQGKVGVEIGAQFFSFYQNYSNVKTVKHVVQTVVECVDRGIRNVELIGGEVKTLLKDQQAVQLIELGQQLVENYKTKETSLHLTSLLCFLYSCEIEICVSLLKSVKSGDPTVYQQIVVLDDEKNSKQLFSRIVKAAYKQNT